MRLSAAVLVSLIAFGCPSDPAPPASDTAGQDSASKEDVSADVGAPDVLEDTTPSPDTIAPDTQPIADTQPQDLGPPADPEVCTGNVKGQLQPYGGSCCYTQPDHPNNPDCVWYSDSYGEGECLDQQCAEGYCSSARYCTKGCSFVIDQVNNHTGEPVPDGVMDTTLPDDCEFAADGPYGAEFHCVNLAAPFKNPYPVCRPGTTFKDCSTTADCPEGEVCSLLYILGETQTRCQIPIKGGAELGEACTSDPNGDIPMTRCKGPLCYGFGCTELCNDAEGCATDTCEAGKCVKNGAACETSADCSALTCSELKPYSDSNFVDDFCWPKECAKAGDCNDPDWFCRPFWNGADKVEDVAFAPMCRKKEEGAVSYGEACGLDGDGTGLPPCAWYYGCKDNYCASPCQSDADCSGGAECLLGTTWNIDVDDDDDADTTLNVDLCQMWPHEGELKDCVTDADCGEGEHCQYRIRGQDIEEGRIWLVEFKCRTDFESSAAFGEACGSDNGKTCPSDLCFVPSNADGASTLCTTYCKSASECPDTVEYDGATWKTVCRSYLLNENGTPDDVDDVYLGYCWYTSPIGSLAACDENKNCPGNLDYCRANTIAGNPDEPVIVEHLCHDYSQGLDEIPTQEVGQPCESWQECKGRRCMSDGAGGGYCSELCATDADCQSVGGLPALRCTEEVLMARPNPENSGVTQRCVLQQTCLSCAVDNDCGGDFICANIGGLGGLADMRCGAPCTPDSGCENPEHNCIEKITPEGNLTGQYACVPSSCE